MIMVRSGSSLKTFNNIKLEIYVEDKRCFFFFFVKFSGNRECKDFFFLYKNYFNWLTNASKNSVHFY